MCHYAGFLQIGSHIAITVLATALLENIILNSCSLNTKVQVAVMIYHIAPNFCGLKFL